MLACPETVSNKACEAAFRDCPERERGDRAARSVEAAV
jgi:hypothetical protein